MSDLFFNPTFADESTYWTRQRRELIRWFNERAPSFSEAYKAAVVLVHKPDFPARIHLICHAIRDIYASLPAALGETRTPRPSEVYPAMVKTLADRWKQFPPTDSKSEHKKSSDQIVSLQVYRSALNLVNKCDQLQNQASIGEQLAGALFAAVERKKDAYIDRWIIDAFNTEYKFFVNRAHLAVQLGKVPTEDGLMEHFQSFERAFHSMLGPYFGGVEELDAILRETNQASG